MNNIEIALPNREKLALAGQGLEVRSSEEIDQIVTWISELGGDDPAKLYRKVLFYLKGKVWGESLFVAKRGELLTQEEILMKIMAVATADDVSLMYEVMAGATEGMTDHGHDVLLYLTMIGDLGGEMAHEMAKRIICINGRGKQLEEGEKFMAPFYFATAGRNIWEWEDDTLKRLLPYFLAVWKDGMKNFHLVFDEEKKKAMSTGLTDLRARLRDMSRIALERKIVCEVPYNEILELASYH